LSYAAGTTQATKKRDGRYEGSSRNEFDATGPIEAKVLEEVLRRFSAVLDLTEGGQTIRTTGEHPFSDTANGCPPTSCKSATGSCARTARRLPDHRAVMVGEFDRWQGQG